MVPDGTETNPAGNLVPTEPCKSVLEITVDEVAFCLLGAEVLT